MTRVKLYVEGGGDSKEQHARCREGFHKLLERAGFSGKLPRIFAGGGRNTTFDQFKTSLRSAGAEEYPILLVDSEEFVTDGTTAWRHLKLNDGWDRPQGVADDQAQLMVTCMETWIIADRAALRNYFGSSLQEKLLIPLAELETRERKAVLDALERATRSCKRVYHKGKRSFAMLAEVDPETLSKHLPHFTAFIQALESHLKV